MVNGQKKLSIFGFQFSIFFVIFERNILSEKQRLKLNKNEWK
jgi:hypothetical protein